MRNVIIVAGHAIMHNLEHVAKDAGWYLLDFQRGEPDRYIGHIRRAVEEAAADSAALLIFSGEASRKEAGPRTEALSY